MKPVEKVVSDRSSELRTMCVPAGPCTLVCVDGRVIFIAGSHHYMGDLVPEVHGKRTTWVLGSRLKKGGFGQVFNARSDTQQGVVKLVPKLDGAGRELLFADDLSGVRNVIPIWDTGETRSHWALVMPKAEKSLEELLEEAGQGLPLEQVIAVLVDTAEALIDLEAKGVVHRDLKPGNILLLHGRWCLADFGISRYTEATTAADTRKGFLTREYAAPEQWRLRRASPQTDVYCLGVTAYEMLSGRRPFTGPSLEDFMDQHLHGDVPALDTPSGPVTALIEQMLSKEPGSRPTPTELLARLQRMDFAEVEGGLALLRDVGKADLKRLNEDARLASLAETRAEIRSGLLQDAERQFAKLATLIKEAIRAYAPTVQLGAVFQGDIHEVERRDIRQGWQMSLGGLGHLRLNPMVASYNASLPFDVIAFTDIAAAQLRHSREDDREYRGVCHSLWYCDAQEPGIFRWFETAFNTLPRESLRYMAPVEPNSLDPETDVAAKAIKVSPDREWQVAIPFNAIDISDPADLIDRWAALFAKSIQGTLTRPTFSYQQEVDSWRHA